MTLQDFIKKYDGKEVDTDGAYGGQCMDLMHKYIVDVLGYDLSLFAASTAYQAYKNADDDRFDKIANSATNVPQPGDIVFWNTGVGSAGHVAVFISGDENSFKSFDQNWPVNSFCHVQDHNYKSVAGWLHPKKSVNTVAVDSDTFHELVDKATKYDNFKAAGYATVEDVLKERSELNNEKNDIQNKLTDEIEKNQELREANSKLTQADEDLGRELVDAQHKLAEEQKPIEKEVEPLVEHALSLQDALDELIMKRAPKKSQSLLSKVVDRLFKWFA